MRLRLFAQTELQHELNEVKVLKQTEEILRTRDANIQEFNKDLGLFYYSIVECMFVIVLFAWSHAEKEKGVEGYQATQDELENVSAATGDVNSLMVPALDWAAMVASPGLYRYVVVGGDGLDYSSGLPLARALEDRTLGYWSDAYGLVIIPSPGAMAMLLGGLGVCAVRRRTR